MKVTGRGAPPPLLFFHAVTNYTSQWLPSWWINVYGVNGIRRHPPVSPSLSWDQRRAHPGSELCAVPGRDNYFHRWIPSQAGWWSGHLRWETITCKHRAGSLSGVWNLVLHRPGSPSSFLTSALAHVLMQDLQYLFHVQVPVATWICTELKPKHIKYEKSWNMTQCQTCLCLSYLFVIIIMYFDIFS